MTNSANAGIVQKRRRSWLRATSSKIDKCFNAGTDRLAPMLSVSSFEIIELIPHAHGLSGTPDSGLRSSAATRVLTSFRTSAAGRGLSTVRTRR
jgi:hypothetical protein